MTSPASNRREFLTGQAARDELQRAGGAFSDQVAVVPSRGPTVMLRTTAMATDFDVILNPDGPENQIGAASAALDEVHRREAQLTVYRDSSEVCEVNRQAALRPMSIEPNLFRLLQRSQEIHRLTEGAFDPAAGALIQLWKTSRKAGRIPIVAEIAQTLPQCGLDQVVLDEANLTVQFAQPGLSLDFGAIGKGDAVDEAGKILLDQGVDNWLVHGGKSSVLAHGTHAVHDGWPVGLRNPLLPDRPYLTLLLKDAALSTSGTAVNWFRHEGKRYGHILDPRTGWPVETMLSVSVIAPEAAMSDALSTAFFVLGVEKTLQCCDNLPEVGVILFPLPKDGRTLEPIVHRVPAERRFMI